MEYKVGKKYHLYNNDACFDFCLAEIVAVMIHPEDETDKLIVYRWFGTHKRWWHYSITTASQQERMKDFVTKMMERKRNIRKNRKEPILDY